MKLLDILHTYVVGGSFTMGEDRDRFFFHVSVMPFKGGADNFEYSTYLSASESSLLISANHRDANCLPVSDPGTSSRFFW